MVEINIFLTARHKSAEYKHKTTAKRLFYAPHLAKRPRKRSGPVLLKLYSRIFIYKYISLYVQN